MRRRSLVVAPYAELVKAIGEAYASDQPEAPPAPDLVVAQPETPQAEVRPEPQSEVQPEPQPEAQLAPPLEPAGGRRTDCASYSARYEAAAIILPRAEEPTNEPEPAPAPLLLAPPAQPPAAAEEKPQVEEPEPVARRPRRSP